MPRNNGPSHVRYDHRRRARDLHLRCPKCDDLAFAGKTSERNQGLLVHDLAGTWHLSDWQVQCTTCLYRIADCSYDALPDLYYRVSARGVELWAWNRDHLQMLHQLLSGEDVSAHSYGSLATYAHRDWLLKKKALAKAVEVALAGH